jgi:twitching motility protein PilT
VSTLENLLRQTAKVGGQELRLIPGRRLLVSTGGVEREVQSPEQSSESILELLSPILNPPLRESLNSGRADWIVRLQGLGAVRVSVESKANGFHASFALNHEEPAAVPSTEDTRPRAAIVQPTPAANVSAGPAAEIESLFIRMYEMKASDLHISVGSPPMVRHDGEMKILDGYSELTAEDTERMLWPIAPDRNREEFKVRHDTDFAYAITGVARFRCNFFMDRKGMGGVFRVIPTKIITAEEMGLSKEILQLCHLSKGLVLVTGPTGSGKSTTLAALVDYINRVRTDHIITIEDPIEFVHDNKKCLINQRQVGEHTDSFKDALRAALREDPDIVLVGEMRDLETVSIAIETAETGHLVFGTLHTSSAASTVDRIIDQFPADRQDQIRVMLAESLKGVISQMLCKKIGGGRVPALEVMIGIPSISNLIREAKIFQIPSIIQTGKKYGMSLMNDSFLDLVKKGIVEPQEAWSKAIDKAGLLGTFKRNNIDVSWAPTESGSSAN